MHLLALRKGGAMMTTQSESPATVTQPVAERITVGLIPKAAEDLRRTQARTGLSKTDVVNRALSLYEFLNERLASGHELLVRRGDTGALELIRLL
jgi:hypothetical protein